MPVSGNSVPVTITWLTTVQGVFWADLGSLSVPTHDRGPQDDRAEPQLISRPDPITSVVRRFHRANSKHLTTDTLTMIMVHPGRVKWKSLIYRCFEDHSPIETDLCIVGTGPAGLSIASEFADAGIRVLLLESGGFEDETDTQALYEIESSGAPRTIDQHLIRRRIFGGSSHVWSGRCAPFDPLDFEKRPWVPYSGWPMTDSEIESISPPRLSLSGAGTIRI